MLDILLYVLLALIVGYLALVGVYFSMKYRKARKQSTKKRSKITKRSPQRQFSDERYQLNLMAMEAARQMAASAARNSRTG